MSGSLLALNATVPYLQHASIAVRCPTCLTVSTLNRKQQATAKRIGHWCDGPGYGKRHTITRTVPCD